MDGGSWRCTGDRDQDEKETQKRKMAVWRGITDSWEKKRSVSKEEKERYTHVNAQL